MAYEALQKWADAYTARKRADAKARRACLACEQEEYLSDPNTDLDAAMMGTRADPHESIYCKKLNKGLAWAKRNGLDTR